MSYLKESILLLLAVVCSVLFVVAIIDIARYWLDTGFDLMFLGKNVLYALATGYWVWRLLIMPYRKRKALEAENN
ncbi:hypothetical protein U0358_12795 [Idiomarina sp. PL1-037]|uniref:hypothetical protein n=1 Tax=unclassified Idiomarina TaxID=2614829 RepID=UPI00294B465F|nr:MULTISPECIES: hypothetical protein [unclassified Idiomarina]MDV6327783.1 hypothetical protein [Idiomarina sp. Sol25]WQC52898.1 hypothetical protein U0358_12795 [Idiomarina sp. PL1-037]